MRFFFNPLSGQINAGPPREVVYSATAPSFPVEGTRWVDTTVMKEYVYTQNFWVEVGVGPAGPAPLGTGVVVVQGDTLQAPVPYGTANVGDSIVQRDANGDFSANVVTADLVGDVTGNITGDIIGDITGNVTGNVTGDVTGNLTGNVTGNLTGNVTGNLTGNVTGNTDTSTKLATARTIALTGAVTGSTLFDGSGNVSIATTVDGLQTALDGKQAAGSYATLVGGLVPSSQLPSYVDDVIEVANFAGLPASGETGKIYITRDQNSIYRWSGTAYIQVSNAVSTAETATKLATVRTISLTGDVTGSATFDGSADALITAVVIVPSHNHDASNITAGTLANDRLPARLKADAQTITDWNNALENGWYQGDQAANAPEGVLDWWLGYVEAHYDRWVTQTVHRFTADAPTNTHIWRRSSADAGAAVRTWGPWYKLQLSQAEQDARYALTAHTHDDRYYTETEMNTLLAGKQAAGSYAPATDIAPSAITGTAVVTTDSRLSDARTPTAHTHDDRYYTETEMNTLLAGKLAFAVKVEFNGFPSATLPFANIYNGRPRFYYEADSEYYTVQWSGLEWEVFYSFRGDGSVDSAFRSSSDVAYPWLAQWIDGRVLDPLHLKTLFDRTSSTITAIQGDNLLTKYFEAKTLTPNGLALSSTNRATLLIMPGSYTINSSLQLNSQYVDVYGLGSQTKRAAVIITGSSVTVSANDIRITGIQAPGIVLSGNNPLQVFENCVSTSSGFGSGAANPASGTFIGCRATSGVGGSFGYIGEASGTFINCEARSDAFGGRGIASGVFIDCVVTNSNSSSFGGGGAGFPTSSFVASGTFIRCSANNYSFGYGGAASGTFTDCSGGVDCFRGANTTGASGTFIRCSAGTGSFGSHDSDTTGTFLYCTTTGNFSAGGLKRFCLAGAAFTIVNT